MIHSKKNSPQEILKFSKEMRKNGNATIVVVQTMYNNDIEKTGET